MPFVTVADLNLQFSLVLSEEGGMANYIDKQAPSKAHNEYTT